MKPLALALLLAMAPPTTEELVKLGEGLAGRGDGKKAIGHLDRALSAADLSIEQRGRAEKAYGLALLQMKNPKDAAAHLERAVEASPKDEKAWLLLGVAFDGAEQYGNAIAAYKKGADQLPKSPTLKHELGMALLQAGKNDEAAKVLVEGTKLAPQDPELATDASYALVVTGKHKEAKEQASLAVSLAPESADAYFNLGSAEAGLGNARAARDALKRALDHDDLHIPSLLQLAHLDAAAGKDADAAKGWLRVLQVEPDNARAKAGLGIALGRLGTDDGKAKGLLEHAVHVDPKNAQAHALLGDIAERAGDLDQAIKRYDAVKKLMPNDAAVKARIEELKAKKKAARK